jgi:hypothetical protein
MPDFYQAFPPNGFDRADGSLTHGGTATPAAAVITAPSTPAFFEERPDSPEIERSIQGTIKHMYKCDPNTAQQILMAYGRGRFISDSFGNVTRVLSSELKYGRMNTAEISITAESISFDTPPDEFSVETVELNPPIEKHPRYAFLTAKSRYMVNNWAQSSQQYTGQDIENYVTQQMFPENDDTPDQTKNPGAIGTNNQNRSALIELMTKRKVGEDTFYMAGFRINWAQYFWSSPQINPGGYIEDPIVDGGLPTYFSDPDWINGDSGTTIFDLCKYYAPQLYKTGISWLRLADTIGYERIWFKRSSPWIGAPYAHWDADLYGNEPSPYPDPPARIISGVLT